MASSMAATPLVFPRNRCGWPVRRRMQTHLPKGASSVVAAESNTGEMPNRRKRPVGTPGVDTRIHWNNQDEGWVGSNTRRINSEKGSSSGNEFAQLVNASATSYYQFLGVPPEADIEEIKAAYRRLSKEYHPDTTSLPLKAALAKFMQLREAYNVLSDEERRRFYNWTLAQEAESQRAERMRMKIEDPYEKELREWESVPDMVDRLGGRNMKLSDQAMTALTIDIFIVLFSICCIIYYVYFKDPY